MKPKKKKPNKPIIHKKHKENPVVVRPKTKHYRANKQSVGSVIHKDHVERNKETPECKHNWIPLIGRVGNKDVPTALFTCMECGEMKVGTNTIRISRYRLDMGGHPLYAGDVVLGENAGLTLDTALSADGKYCGIVEDGTAGATLAFGDLCYFITASSKWGLAKADSTTTSGDVKLGICVLAGNDTQATKMLLYGKIRADAKFPTLTISAPVYVSGANAGLITVTAPTTADYVAQRIGLGNTADELFFCPSQNYFTRTAGWYGERGISALGQGTAGFVNQNIIEYITFATFGNTTDFGDATRSANALAGCSDGVRGITAGGYGGTQNTIDYVTISTLGNAIDFGDLTRETYAQASASNNLLGLFLGGTNVVNIIDYVTIATTGNAIDFGDLSTIRYGLSGVSDGTKAIVGGGNNNSVNVNVIEYVNFATTGNAIDFGDLLSANYLLGSFGSKTRGIFSTGDSNVIAYITMATLGNATDFGDMSPTVYYIQGCSNTIAGVFFGGYSAITNIIQYITIDTLGNSADFGDLSTTRLGVAAFSGN